jgi:adenylate cyclase
MGVRYVIEGSVRKANDQIRVTAQLIDGTTGGHLWPERYDRPLTDIFALQDEIRQKIVTALKVKLTPEEQERFRRAPTTSLEAYSYYLRGQEYFFRFTKETILQGRQMFERAIELDPKYAAAYARLGGTYRREWIGGWSQELQVLERTFEFVQQAAALNRNTRHWHTRRSVRCAHVCPARRYFRAHGARYCMKAQAHDCTNLLWSDLDDSLALAHSILGLVYQG